MEKIIVRTHYEERDIECGGDYFDIEIIKDGKVIAEFGDYYHDKGEYGVAGFIEGLKYASGKEYAVVYENVADR